MATQLRGPIDVSSESVQGAHVEVFRPGRDGEPKPTETGVAGTTRGTGRVLLVDDDEPITRMMKEVLERRGYDVVTATNGITALELFRAHPSEFDIVITDLTMPRLSGLDLAREIAAIAPRLPILLCTGFGDAPELDVPSAVRCIIPKPIPMTDLAALIHRTLRQEETPKASLSS